MRNILSRSVSAALGDLQLQARLARESAAKRSPTGRVTTPQPALQSIPVRTAEGRRIREAFRTRG